jgi:hypothetical protein
MAELGDVNALGLCLFFRHFSMFLNLLKLILKVCSFLSKINVSVRKADINIKEKTVEAQTQAQFG